jgi:hypothetical protein
MACNMESASLFSDTLEGYSYEEPWPKEIRGFVLSYQDEPRKLKLPAA